MDAQGKKNERKFCIINFFYYKGLENIENDTLSKTHMRILFDRLSLLFGNVFVQKINFEKIWEK